MSTKKQIIDRPLSKSAAMTALQCEKYFWLNLFDPKLAGPVSSEQEKKFKQGDEVGELARKLEGKGVLIDNPFWEFDKSAQKTQEHINNGETTIYEAAFLKNNLFVRADILKKVRGKWEIIEVKSATSVKDQYYQDVAFQVYVIELTGLKIEKIKVRHINREMVYPNFDDFFTTEDVTKTVREEIKNIKTLISKTEKLKKLTTAPKVKVGEHCQSPYECPFRDHCWKKYLDKDTVLDLPFIKEKRWSLFNEGKILISDLDPRDFEGSTKRAIELFQKNKLTLDLEKIKSELSTWKFPLYSFDFETLQSAIPRFHKSSPYDQIPFQFSVHIWKSPEEYKLEHFEFLHSENSDPRPRLIEEMLKRLGTKGSIVAYFKQFESDRIKELAYFDKKNSAKLLALLPRMVDPLPLLRSAVYHPSFKNSFSLKSTAPGLLGKKGSYNHLEITDGGIAQEWAMELIFGNLEESKKEEIIKHLLSYCKQDTLVVMDIVNFLLKKIK